MKPSEAIANIEYARKWLGTESDFSDEALDMAIEALEKQEQDIWHSVADETIYKGYHTFDSFGYCMGNILSFDEEGKIIRTED